jgi:assimilatory nitrate reductase catalytic subunit
MLAGRAARGGQDRGAIVCSCFEVGVKQITKAALKGCNTVEQIGKELHAGTNCGSCRTEIRKIIESHREARAT